MKKRYQYFSKNGIEWTNWFICHSKEKPEIQYKRSNTILLNEYDET